MEVQLAHLPLTKDAKWAKMKQEERTSLASLNVDTELQKDEISSCI